MSQWTPVTKNKPCPACDGVDWCAWTPDGSALRCMRGGEQPHGMRQQKTDADGGTLYVFAGGNGRAAYRPNRTRSARTSTAKPTDWKATADRLAAKLTPERMAALADATGVPDDAWAKLSPGWAGEDNLRVMRASGKDWAEDYPAGAWTFPERDGHGRIVTLSLRAIDGRKGAPAGAKRGLIVPADLHKLTGPVLIVEGASDVAACRALGLPAVGRPSNRGGAAYLAEMLDGRDVLVVGERDHKDGGAWPGRDGAKAVATQLASRWGESVGWALPPEGTP